MTADLLPSNATAWERAIANAMDLAQLTTPSIDAIRGTKLTAPPPGWLPFLIWEYGLGELTPFVPNLYDLIEEGIDWQRVRGTPAAIALALNWLTYTAEIEEESTLRRYWNLFQLEVDRVRDARVDLERIAGVAQLSVPKRSVFWRGFHGFDIRPLTYGEKAWGESHFAEYSGVRLAAGGPLWSFGRKHEADHVMVQAELEALGVWLPPVEDDDDLGWEDFSWNDTEASWQSDASRARSEAMASDVMGRPAWFQFKAADGEIIGYRRARATHFVTPVFGGTYDIAGDGFEVSDAAQTSIYVECLTDFGEGDGQTAATVGLVLDALPLDETKPGLRWLAPEDIGPGTASVAIQEFTIPFGESIRDRVKFLLRF